MKTRHVKGGFKTVYKVPISGINDKKPHDFESIQRVDNYYTEPDNEI